MVVNYEQTCQQQQCWKQSQELHCGATPAYVIGVVFQCSAMRMHALHACFRRYINSRNSQRSPDPLKHELGCCRFEEVTWWYLLVQSRGCCRFQKHGWCFKASGLRPWKVRTTKTVRHFRAWYLTRLCTPCTEKCRIGKFYPKLVHSPNPSKLHPGYLRLPSPKPSGSAVNARPPCWTLRQLRRLRCLLNKRETYLDGLQVSSGHSKERRNVITVGVWTLHSSCAPWIPSHQ